MAQSVLNGDYHYNGALSAKTLNPPPGCITNTAIAAAANIDATKVNHQQTQHVSQAPGTAVVSATTHVHIARFSGEVVAIEAMTPTPATGADRQVTIDLQKSTAGGAFATVLSAPITLTNATVARTPVAGTVTTTAFVDGDILQVVVAVAGALNNQAQGLGVVLTLRESPV